MSNPPRQLGNVRVRRLKLKWLVLSCDPAGPEMFPHWFPSWFWCHFSPESVPQTCYYCYWTAQAAQMLRGEEAHRPSGVSEQVLNQQISEWGRRLWLLNHKCMLNTMCRESSQPHILACACMFLSSKKKNDFNIDSCILCKRSITYQGVCLLDGDRPYDTLIHQITKTHLLLYSGSFTACLVNHIS